jgi:twinkle protein
MRLPLKDACDMLAAGREEEFVRAFYDAKKPKISGIADGLEILDQIKAVCEEEKICLPDFMSSVNRALGGGYSPSSFNIIAAQTSVGKSTVAYQILEYFVKSGIKTGDISLEASAGQVGEHLVGLHTGQRLVDVEDLEEKIAIVENNFEDLKQFFYDEEGNSNLYILDDRSLLEDIDDIFKNIEKLIRVCGCRVIIIDVLSDLMDTMSNEEQADFMGRIKKLIARHTICIVGIMHMRKPGDKKNVHDVSEFDIYGSSTAIKSAHSVILLSRDKLSEEQDERNTTRVKLSKNRGTGRTGRMTDIFYDMSTGRLRERVEDVFDG